MLILPLFFMLLLALNDLPIYYKLTILLGTYQPYHHSPCQIEYHFMESSVFIFPRAKVSEYFYLIDRLSQAWIQQ
jgi:uncharacterized membrane protein